MIVNAIETNMTCLLFWKTLVRPSHINYIRQLLTPFYIKKTVSPTYVELTVSDFVPTAGVEPARVSSQVFETSASTDSARWAFVIGVANLAKNAEYTKKFEVSEKAKSRKLKS